MILNTIRRTMFQQGGGQFIDLSYLDAFGNTLLSRNTANTYIVYEPGFYCFPLVYGNGIKNGSENSKSYTKLPNAINSLDYVNHTGNPITVPYIEFNTDCSASTVSLEYQTHSGMVKNLKLLKSDGTCRYVGFSVNSIPSSNGWCVISLKNSSGIIMWSWTIWMKSSILSLMTITNYLGETFQTFNENLCYDSSTTGGPFFTRGQPFIKTYKYGYKIDGSTARFSTGSNSNVSVSSIISNIQNPLVNFGNSAQGYTLPKNLWNRNLDCFGTAPTHVPSGVTIPRYYKWNTKTVYDPSPYGFVVPSGGQLKGVSASVLGRQGGMGYSYRAASTNYLAYYSESVYLRVSELDFDSRCYSTWTTYSLDSPSGYSYAIRPCVEVEPVSSPSLIGLQFSPVSTSSLKSFGYYRIVNNQNMFEFDKIDNSDFSVWVYGLYEDGHCELLDLNSNNCSCNIYDTTYGITPSIKTSGSKTYVRGGSKSPYYTGKINFSYYVTYSANNTTVVGQVYCVQHTGSK